MCGCDPPEALISDANLFPVHIFVSCSHICFLFTNLYPVHKFVSCSHIYILFKRNVSLCAFISLPKSREFYVKDQYDGLLFHRNHSLIRSHKSDQSYLSSNTRFDFFSLLGSRPASTTLTIGVNPIAALVFAAIFLLSSAKSTCPLTAST